MMTLREESRQTGRHAAYGMTPFAVTKPAVTTADMRGSLITDVSPLLHSKYSGTPSPK